MDDSKRIWYLDYLRVLAIVMVFLIHIPGTTKGIEFKSSAWYLFNIVHDLSRWTIPVLVMISGSLFLSRDIPIKVIYKKYVLRLVIAYFV